MIPDLSAAELAALSKIIARELVTSGGSTTPKTSASLAPPSKPGTKFTGIGEISPRLCIIKVTSAASGGGYYNGSMYFPGDTMWASSGNVTSTKIEGRLLGTCVAVNFGEVGTSNHDLISADNTLQRYFVGLQIGRSGDHPLFALLGNAVWLDTCPVESTPAYSLDGGTL